MEQKEHLKTGMIPYLTKRYRESGRSQEEMEKILHLAADIINSFPCRQDKREYLAVFVAMLTGNPHAFDDGTRDGQLLYLLVQWMGKSGEKERQETEIRDNSESSGVSDKPAALEISAGRQQIFPALIKQKQYLAAGILRDDISNFVMISGICAWKKNGEIHVGMEGFCMEGDMVQVPRVLLQAGKKQHVRSR